MLTEDTKEKIANVVITAGIVISLCFAVYYLGSAVLTMFTR